LSRGGRIIVAPSMLRKTRRTDTGSLLVMCPRRKE